MIRLPKALMESIHAGDVETLKGLLREHPGLASARIVDDKGGTRTTLHVGTDWSGFFPCGPQVVAVLIEAGADPDARVEGMWHFEPPLHWAASSDDVEVARVLIAGGADLETAGRSRVGARSTMRSGMAGAGGASRRRQQSSGSPTRSGRPVTAVSGG